MAKPKEYDVLCRIELPYGGPVLTAGDRVTAATLEEFGQEAEQVAQLVECGALEQASGPKVVEKRARDAAAAGDASA